MSAAFGTCMQQLRECRGVLKTVPRTCPFTFECSTNRPQIVNPEPMIQARGLLPGISFDVVYPNLHFEIVYYWKRCQYQVNHYLNRGEFRGE